MKKFILFVTAIVLAFSFASCDDKKKEETGGGGGGGGTKPPISKSPTSLVTSIKVNASDVIFEDEDEIPVIDFVYVYVEDDRGGEFTIAEAEYKNGFEVQLPANPTGLKLYKMSDDLFDEVTDESLTESFYFSDSEVRISNPIVFEAYHDDEDIGEFMIEHASRSEEYIVEFFYVDRDAVIIGSVEGLLNIDLNLRKGWNQIVVRITEDEKDNEMFEMTTNIPKNYKWYYEDWSYGWDRKRR